MSHLLAAIVFFGRHLPLLHHACHDRHRNQADDQKNHSELCRSAQHFYSTCATQNGKLQWCKSLVKLQAQGAA
jgi:hypothetical protein